jgi:hypothetical protein
MPPPIPQVSAETAAQNIADLPDGRYHLIIEPHSFRPPLAYEGGRHFEFGGKIIVTVPMAVPHDYRQWSREDLIIEVQRLKALVEGRFKEARLMSAAPDGTGAFVLDIQTGLSGVMAENMLAILRGEGAPNFVQVEATHPEEGPLTFTIERRFGRSPAVQLAEAKARIAELEAAAGAAPTETP